MRINRKEICHFKLFRKARKTGHKTWSGLYPNKGLRTSKGSYKLKSFKVSDICYIQCKQLEEKQQQQQHHKNSSLSSEDQYSSSFQKPD